MFEDLKKNIEQEKKIITDMRSIQAGIENDAINKPFYLSTLDALSHQLILLNKTVPELLKEWSPIKKFAEKIEKVPALNKTKKQVSNISKPSIVRMSYVSPSTKENRYITISKTDKKTFLEKLKLSEQSLRDLKKLNKENFKTSTVDKPNTYAMISNKFFLKYSEKLVPIVSDLNQDLKKANIRFLLSTYLSMAIMSMILSFVVGILIFVIIILINSNNWIYFLIPFGLTGLTMTGFYLYPASEADAVQKKISQELPFAAIHMAAIAGSNIEPTKIFKIIAASKEYTNIGKEMKKIIAQVDIYGYDLVTALKNVARQTSNKKLAEMFSGFATNIATGGELKNYIEKKAENYLLDYRLEREEYSKTAGTFMDIYISILIAAPLILMMMFIVMNVAGLGMGGLSITSLLFLSIGGIIIVNIIFLAVLNAKQPNV